MLVVRQISDLSWLIFIKFRNCFGKLAFDTNRQQVLNGLLPLICSVDFIFPQNKWNECGLQALYCL